MSFGDKVREAQGTKRIEFLEVKRALSDVALEQVIGSTRPNYLVYVALTHLAEVKELKIDIQKYFDISIAPLDSRLDISIYELAKNKFKELNTLLQREYVGV